MGDYRPANSGGPKKSPVFHVVWVTNMCHELFLSCVFFVFPFVWVTNMGDYVEVEHLRNTQHQLHFCGRDRQRMCIFLPTLKTFLGKGERENIFLFLFNFLSVLDYCSCWIPTLTQAFRCGLAISLKEKRNK